MVEGLHELAHSEVVVSADVAPSDLDILDRPVELMQLGVKVVYGKLIFEKLHE